MSINSFQLSYSDDSGAHDLVFHKHDGNALDCVVIGNTSYRVLSSDNQILTVLQKHGPFSSLDEVKRSLLERGITDLTFSTELKSASKKTATVVTQKLDTSKNFIDKGLLQLMRMVRNSSSEADIIALCRHCLALNNNNPALALAQLNSVFSGRVSEKISSMLLRMASDKNFNEIKAFGRNRTFDVICFLKALPQTANGAIDLTKMKKIGEGGTQDVYVLEGASPFVLKVNRASLSMSGAEREKKYTSDNAAYKKLHASFGDHCTVEQLLLRTVVDASGAKEAIISVADFEKGFKAESKIGLQTADGNVVAIAKNSERYEKMLKSLFVLGREVEFSDDLFKRFNPEFAKVVDLIKKDPDFCDAMKKFLTKFKEYFKETCQYLDIQGRDNIIFFKENGQWTFKLGTVIKRESAQEFAAALDSVAVSKEFKDKRRVLSNCFHWTKTVNALGMIAKIGRIIDDENCSRVGLLWNNLKDFEAIIPQNLNRTLQIVNVVEEHAADEIVAQLTAISFNPEDDMNVLMNLFSGFTHEKQLVLAKYLHEQLPRATDVPPNYSFCSDRFRMALSLSEFSEGKPLALEFFNDVAKDPDGPLNEVLSLIEKLKV